MNKKVFDFICKNDVQIVRSFDWDDIRARCIANNWYTQGTNEDYNNLHEYVKAYRRYTDTRLFYVAVDIYQHTNTETERYFGCSENEIIESIFADIYEHLSFYVEITKED